MPIILSESFSFSVTLKTEIHLVTSHIIDLKIQDFLRKKSRQWQFNKYQENERKTSPKFEFYRTIIVRRYLGICFNEKHLKILKTWKAKINLPSGLQGDSSEDPRESSSPRILEKNGEKSKVRILVNCFTQKRTLHELQLVHFLLGSQRVNKVFCELDCKT